MNRYLLFGGDTYYPLGGWDDFIESYETVDEAEEEALREESNEERREIILRYADSCVLLDWSHIIDKRNGNKVRSYYRGKVDTDG